MEDDRAAFRVRDRSCEEVIANDGRSVADGPGRAGPRTDDKVALRHGTIPPPSMPIYRLAAAREDSRQIRLSRSSENMKQKMFD